MTLKPEHIVEALNKTPELKRRLILRIMEELLDSEAFMRLRNQMRQGMDALWKQNVPPASIDTTMKGAYRAETVWLTIRYALAWHDFPEGGQWVDFYEPMNRSDQPMPKVELKLKGEEK